MKFIKISISKMAVLMVVYSYSKNDGDCLAIPSTQCGICIDSNLIENAG